MSSLTTLSKENILQVIASQEKRIAKLEALLQGQQIGTVRIANASIGSAKIQSLSVSKLTTGVLSANTLVYIGAPGSGNYIEQDGGEVRIVMYKDAIPQMVMGSE